MAALRRLLHTSSSGDRWFLCRNGNGQIFVMHEPNAASGGKSSQSDLSTFLANGNQGPEHQALRSLIGELVDPSRLPAEYDDHD
jgi:hypothetical protein